MVFDAIVIGAGPSGARISGKLSKKGFKVLMMDVKSEVGIPNHCSGLVDERVVKIVGYDLVLEKPEIAEVMTPASSLFLRSGRMFVLDRVRLDKKLVEISVSEGTYLKLRTKFIGYKNKGKVIEVFASSGGNIHKFETNMLIGSDGPTSLVRNYAGIKSPRLLPSVQFDVEEKISRVKIYLDRHKTPDFFSWEIPHLGENEIGASGKGAIESVRNLAKGKKIIRQRGGVIPVGPTDLGRGNVFLTGDSAGLNKATTGGGLYAALMSSDSLAQAIESGDNILENYKKIWRSSFGKEIDRDYQIRRLLDKVEKHYKIWVPFVRANINGINTVGDVDYPSKTLIYLLVAGPFRIDKILKEFISMPARSRNYNI